MRKRTLAQTQHRRLTSHSRVRPSLKQATLAGISLDPAADELASDTDLDDEDVVVRGEEEAEIEETAGDQS